MIPIVTPSEMAGVDRAAAEPVEVLVGRAGFEAARTARAMLGGCYGRRVVVVAGRGNNGADGRAAAAVLRRWGAAAVLIEAGSLRAGDRLPDADLVIDAAYGTGLSRAYTPPDPGGAPVLAIDIPSGLSGVTGEPVEGGVAVVAARTVTFAALKPGLLLGDGPEHTGTVRVAGIGLAALADAAARAWLVTDADFAAGWTPRARRAHKWQTAVQVVGGSPAMHGAPLLMAQGALRAGAGYARVGVPGGGPGGGLPPGEHVGHGLPEHAWGEEAAVSARRARAIAVGPGLGELARGAGGGGGAASPVGRLLIAAGDLPAVVDADALGALGPAESLQEVLGGRSAPVVLTPHEGEYRSLVGRPPDADRIRDVRDTAAKTGAVVLLKGSPTVVAGPDGRVLVVNAGSARLATAGTGDVLTGVIAAFLARGLPALEAAAFAAHCHGRAAALGPAEGLVASDLPALVSRWLSRVAG